MWKNKSKTFLKRFGILEKSSIFAARFDWVFLKHEAQNKLYRPGAV